MGAISCKFHFENDERDMSRRGHSTAATKAKYHAVLEGKTPEIGERFFYEGSYFTLENDGSVLYFQAEIAGKSQNEILPGTQAVPVNHIEGLISAKFGMVYENGSDAESDENLRTRILEKIAGPAENGNIQHYKTWCESIEGVGRARIIPLWNGENTVKAALIDASGKPLGAAKVAEVQRFIDPADKGMTAVVGGREYVVGDGLGNGAANIGAHFTAAAAEQLDITVTFSAELAPGMTAENVRQEASDELEKYLKELVLSADENFEIVVRISTVGAILSRLKSLTDYSDLKLNGETRNIAVDGDFVPVLKEVTVT